MRVVAAKLMNIVSVDSRLPHSHIVVLLLTNLILPCILRLGLDLKILNQFGNIVIRVSIHIAALDMARQTVCSILMLEQSRLLFLIVSESLLIETLLGGF